MKKLIFILLFIPLLLSCDNNSEDIIGNQIDESILGTWKVDYSISITNIIMGANNTFKLIGESDTVEFKGEKGTAVHSYLFGRQENLIKIRKDSRINVYLLNHKDGITITNDYINYIINNEMMICNKTLYHNYRVDNDTLIIERIPDQNTSWTYTRTKYIRTHDI